MNKRGAAYQFAKSQGCACFKGQKSPSKAHHVTALHGKSCWVAFTMLVDVSFEPTRIIHIKLNTIHDSACTALLPATFTFLPSAICLLHMLCMDQYKDQTSLVDTAQNIHAKWA